MLQYIVLPIVFSQVYAINYETKSPSTNFCFNSKNISADEHISVYLSIKPKHYTSDTQTHAIPYDSDKTDKHHRKRSQTHTHHPSEQKYSTALKSKYTFAFGNHS